MNVADWLDGLELGVQQDAFAENNIDLHLLPDLTTEDLSEISVTKVGHRRKILSAIATQGQTERPAPAELAKAPGPAGFVHDLSERRQITVVSIDLSGQATDAVDPIPDSVKLRLFERQT